MNTQRMRTRFQKSAANNTEVREKDKNGKKIRQTLEVSGKASVHQHAVLWIEFRVFGVPLLLI